MNSKKDNKITLEALSTDSFNIRLSLFKQAKNLYKKGTKFVYKDGKNVVESDFKDQNDDSDY